MDKQHSLIENFEQIKGLLATYGPAQLQDLREAAIAAYGRSGIPTSKDEEFKYTSLRALQDGKFKPAYGATVERFELEETALGKVEGITVAFVNGEYAPELCSDNVLPDGVFVGTLKDALFHGEARVLEHLGKIARLENKLGSSNDERFVDLNTAFLGEGAVIYVPKGVTLEAPVHLAFLGRADHGPFASHPRVLIVLEENAQAKVVESYSGLQGVYFTNAVTEVFVGPNSILEHTRFQQETEGSIHIANLSVHQEADSTFTSNNAAFGATVSRVDLNVWLNGEHTETWLNGVAVGLGNQVMDNHTRIDHAKPNCNSFEVYKSVLGDRALGVFNGKIFVYEDAQKTDAKQTNQAILLSPTATINTKPQLEIFADDVKCTHGATVGQLREDALFYLRARGIPLKEARAILVYAFAAEVLEKVTVEAARVALEKVLFDTLNKTEALPEA